MAKLDFWKDWKRTSKIEQRAIQGVVKARKILLDSVSNKKLVAIYVKGSFVRREMLPTSDVDIVPIVNDNKYLNKIIHLDKEMRHFYAPAELLPISLWELKHKQLYAHRDETGPKGRPSIDQFSTYKLIWGKALDATGFPSRTKTERFQGLLAAFDKIFLPLYKEKKFGFDELVKQVFWLTDLEQHIRGKNPSHVWKKLARSSPKNHIVRDALKLRKSKNKTRAQKERFLRKLIVHLNKLQKFH